MRVLINLSKERLSALRNYKGVTFLGLDDGGLAEDAVIVVVRGPGYDDALEKALQLDRPVVVVAGTDGAEGQHCIARARASGVADECIIVIRGEQIVTLAGDNIVPAAGKRIGARALLKVAEKSLQQDLRPEPVIWEEGVDAGGAGEDPLQEAAKAKRQTAKPALRKAPVTGRWVSTFKGLLESADTVIAVFRSTANAQSDRVAATLAERLGGVHVELSASPASIAAYNEDLDFLLESGRYLHTNGSDLEGEYNGAKCIIVEVDPAVPDSKALELAYSGAANVIHVVDADEPSQGKAAIEAWLKSGWRLDAVVPDDPAAAEAFRKHFKDLVQPDPGDYSQKLIE